MSRFFITGDTHCTHDFYKLTNWYFNKDNELGLTKDDYLIICGDFGVIWNDEYEFEKYLLDWYNDKPWTTLFVDGNHEGFTRLNSYPVEEWNGGKVHCIKDSVYHLMRGQVFEIDGRKFFAMGGANSHDKERRIEGESWWAEELPSEEERAEAIANLTKHNWKVDYVITHEAPTHIADYLICEKRDYTRGLDEYMNWLEDEIAMKLDFKQWYHGHYHIDMEYEDEKYMSMRDRIVSIDDYKNNLCSYRRSFWDY